MHIARHVNVGLGKKCILSLSVVLSTLVFTPRSDAVIYYVNNNSTNGNVYTTAVGNDANPGTNAAAPKATMTNLLATVNLLPGDIVYIDTGTYSNYTTTVTNSGAIGNPIIFIGSTNLAAGGTVFNRNDTAQNNWNINNASDIHLRHITFRGALRGVLISGTTGAERNAISDCVMRNNNRGVLMTLGAKNNTITRSILAANTGVQFELSNAASNSVTHSVLSGLTPVNFTGPSASMLNFNHNIVRASGATRAFDMSPGFFHNPPDYNVYHLTGGAVMAFQTPNTYTTLNDFQTAFDVDWRSSAFDPLFADVSGLDFHLRSEFGRWNGAAFTNDSVTSRAIDIGNRALVFTNEPPPNGNRINIGRYGNTGEASVSRPDPWLLALTYRDGGTLNVSDFVYWTYGNIATTQTVRIELSRDSGGFWEVVATNLPIHVESYQWLNTNYASSIFARWRVVLESDPSVIDAVPTNFVYRNGPFVYYVNNADTNGNVYTSAPGNDANLGTSAGAPKATLRSLVDDREIQAGDIIYIDTGVYTFSQDQTISALDAGDNTARIIIQGSTNVAAGGTVLRRHTVSQIGIVLDLSGGSYYDIRDLTIVNASTGIRLRNSTSNGLTRVSISNAGTGVDIDNSQSVLLDQVATYNCSVNGIRQVAGGSQSRIQRSVSWGNTRAGIRVEGGSMSVSNSVIVAYGNDAYAYHAAATNSILGNYNNVYAASNAVLGYVSLLGRNLNTLSSWVHETGSERRSLSDDPRFANPSAGDFHPMTETRDGRFIPGVGFNPGWDDVTSPLIDAGDPTWSFGNEKMPNGGRINIGMFGNTAEASVGRTNAWLYVATLRNGGVARGNTTLHWVSGFIASNETVTLRYSPDGGQTWSVLAASLPVTNEVYVWNTTTTNDTPAGVWHVTLDSNTNLFDFTRTFFSVRNANLSIYINNSTTNGNVWTTGPGRSTNWVATASRPLDSLPTALSTYRIEPGDTIYVDTGAYTNFSNPTLTRLHAGTAANPVRIQGSTNEVAGGTVLFRSGTATTAYGLHIDRSEWISVSNIAFRSGRFGVRINNASQIELGRVQARGSLSNAFHAVFSTNIAFRRSVAMESFGVGLFVQSVAPARWLHSVIWSNSEGAVVAMAGDLSVTNSVLQTSGSGKRVYWSISNAVIRSDYNNLLATSDASVARVGSSEARNVIRWQALTSNDLHSLSHDPLFFNPSSGDFRPRSAAGRYDLTAQNYVTTDTNTSFMIDTGDPLAAIPLEPIPNGGRINIGPFGNTTQASKSDTNAWLLALTLNDGGSVRDTNAIYWVAGGSATGHTVSIWISVNGGTTWTNIAGGIDAADGFYEWDTTQHPSSPFVLWRVVSEDNTNVLDQTDNTFSINNNALSYYVNNDSTNNNVYTSAPGSPDNDGLTPDSPLPSIQSVLSKWELFPGDHIYVDTGEYTMTNGVIITSVTRGQETNRITIVGSTNYAAGGTVLNFGGLFNGITLNGTEGIAVEHIQVANARIGIRSVESGNCLYQWVRVRNSGTGFELDHSTNAMFRHCLVAGSITNGLYIKSSPSASWDHGVLWSNRFGVRLDRTLGAAAASDTTLTFSNSVIAAHGANAIAYWRNAGTVLADYNNVYATDGALVGLISAAIYPRNLPSMYVWHQATGNDRNSLSHEPGFADPEGGDFHLMTQAPAGRQLPSGGFTNDVVTSIMIDAGAPSAVATNEPAPNGGRINIGLYGGTSGASHTPTNSALAVLSLHDGGIVQGTTNLLWLGQGNVTSHLLQIELTVNTGLVWTIIATNVPASAGSYSLNSTLYSNTLNGLWRVRSETENAVVAETAIPFAVRNAPFKFYVNNSSTNGNVYTSSPGLSTHDGLRTNTPMHSLQGILDKWDVEPGDIIYVDTGVYTNPQPIRITQADSGVPYGDQQVVIQGSTNELAGGTVLDMGGAAAGIIIEDAAQIHLNHLKIRNAGQGVLVRRSEGNRFTWLEVVGGTTGYGIDFGFNNEFRHCVARNVNGSGLVHAASSNTVWQSGVLWSNQFGASATASTNFTMSGGGDIFQISNTVIGVFGPNSMAVRRLTGPFVSDYNNYYLVDGALAGQDGSDVFLSVSRWVRDTGRDRHTLSHEPGFFNAGMADFHPVSQTGRYHVASAMFVPDLATSMLIDSGGPLADFSQESNPNGGRINIGLYGNDWQASRSPTNSRLTAIAFNDGGRVEGTNGLLVWAAAGNVTGHLVTIEFSFNGGAVWEVIASNVAASAAEYVWDTTQQPSTIKALWKVTSETEAGVSATNSQFFAVRNDPIPFYVNNSSTNGNVYTTAAGNPLNEGLFPNEPKDSVQGILSQWKLEPGDIIYMDTGVYSNNTSIVFNQFSAGDFSNQVYLVLQGSTNTAAGGTIIDRMGGADGIQLTQAPAIELRNLNLRNMTQNGVSISASDGARLEWVHVNGGLNGVRVENSISALMRHCSARNATSAGLSVQNATGAQWLSGVLWMNRIGVSGRATVSNSVVGASGTNAMAYSYALATPVLSDYNAIHLINGAVVAERSVPGVVLPEIYFTISRYARDTGQDRNSLAYNPLFVDADNGDFHLLSQGGRFHPASGWTNDAVTSPLIDAGHLAADFSQETELNGGRVNIGLYGNSAEASRTPTNAALNVISLRDGGRTEGQAFLRWLAQGGVTSHTVKVEVSSDGGDSWQTLTTGRPASEQVFVWDTTISASSARGMWRVVSETDTNVFSQTLPYFAIRNEPLLFYVNNVNTQGLVYTTAPGHPDNSGVLPNEPKDSIPAILTAWDLEPGDVVYVDTGTYLTEDEIRIDRFDSWHQLTNLTALASGLSSNRVTIFGSTNFAAGGTVINRVGSGNVIHVDNAPGVAVMHIATRQGTTGLRATASPYGLAEWVRCEKAQVGFHIHTSNEYELRHCVSRENSGRGLYSQSSGNVTWQNGVLWSNAVATFLFEGDLAIQHSVIAVFGSNSIGQVRSRGNLFSDYNNYFTQDGGYVGGLVPSQSLTGPTNRYQSTRAWNRATAQDARSLSVDPLFANPALGDFHLKTSRTAGRYDPFASVWTNDTEFSRLIDAGNPDSPFDNEPEPNGARINIGLYGNTPEASLTPTGAWLTAVTLADGGSAEGTMDLYFVAGGTATGQLFYLEYSPLAGFVLEGFDWADIASNVSASAGTVVWNSELYQAAHIAVWKVTSTTDTNLYDIAGTFQSRGDPETGLPYFVNDASISNDVFTTAPGSVLNLGINPNAPALSVQSILQTFQIEGRDTIFVDTGTYPLTGPIRINQSDSGTTNAFIVIRGSTNWAAGGTVFDRLNPASGTSAFLFEDLAMGIELRDLALRNAGTGVLFDEVTDIRLVNVRSHSHTVAGFTLNKSGNIHFEHSSIWGIGSEEGGVGIQSTESSLTWHNGVIWSDGTAVNLNSAGAHVFRNSVLRSSGSGNRIFRMDLLTSLTQASGDYNNFLYENGSIIAEKSVVLGGNEIIGDMVEWRRAVGSDVSTLSHAPLFVDTLNGNFSLRSTAGRFLPDGSLTNDTIHSPMIDTGDPLAVYTNELDPNGARINIGIYGNTALASMSRTNPWLLAVSLNDGGTIGGTQRLIWASGNLTNGAQVRLEYSRNNGITWDLIASNVVNTATGYMWNVTGQQPLGFFGRWRVVWQDDPSEQKAANTNDAPFAIKNNPIVVYVNDGSQLNDVYTTAPGAPGNTGLSPGSPLNDPEVALRSFPLGAGDIVYIDTGYYQVNDNLLLGELTRGVTGLPIRIQGSTNRWGGGTVIDRVNANDPVMAIQDTRFIELDHVKFTGGSVGLSVANSERVKLSWVEVFSNSSHGISLNSVVGFEALRTVAWNNGGWGVFASSAPVIWDNGVLWSNTLGGLRASVSSIAMRNSVVHSPKPGSYLYEFTQSGFAGSDYNFLYVQPGAKLIRDAQQNIDLQNMQQFRRLTGGDRRSVLENPRFVNPGAGDFHLQSEAGSYTNGSFVGQPTTSWAIDAADPVLAFANEPPPNGGRRNVGLYGNTHEASRSMTNETDKAFLAVSMSDGGLLVGDTNSLLYWLSRGYTTSDLVRVEYSRDDGETWSVIVSNVPATQSEILWDASNIDSTPLAHWRVVEEANTNNVGQPDGPFVLRTGATFFYVNDANTNGTIYTEGPGHPNNIGLEPLLPNSSVENIINRFDLIGGDVIYVDTGFYSVTNFILITSLDSGVATAKISIVGSTNYAAGGSVLHGSHTSFVGSVIFNLRQASHVNIENLTLQNADTPIYLELFSANNTFSNLLVRDGGAEGVRLQQASNNRFRNTVITRHQVGVRGSTASANSFDHSIIWSNASHAIFLNTGNMWVSNSVLSASGEGNMIYFLDDVSTVRSDFNNLYVTNGARYGQFGGIPVQGLPQWVAASGQDVHSLSVDPMFADAASDDYHLRSVIGRYDPVAASWTNDVDHSLLIDTGDPARRLAQTNIVIDGETVTTNVVALEPEPNGNRVNIGLHGATPEASQSLTTPWLYAVTASSGGRMGGVVRLAWAGGGMSFTNRVHLDYSHDNGDTWFGIAEGQSLTNWSYLWDSTEDIAWIPSPNARWRISLEADTNVYHVTDLFFGLNGPFTFYVNDGSTNGDVYATAIGSDTNFGTRAWEPKATLRNILDTFDLEGEDRVLIDTGFYTITTNELAVMEVGDQGDEFNTVVIQGSTNAAFGGSVFSFSGAGIHNLLTIQGQYVDIFDLTFRGGGFSATMGDLYLSNIIVSNGNVVLNGRNFVADRLRVIGGNLTSPATNLFVRGAVIGDGGATFSGANVSFENSVIYGGLAGSVALLSSATDMTIRNNTLAGGGSQVRFNGGENILMENNILVADGTDRFCVIWDAGSLSSDYNNLLALNGAWIGARNGQWENLLLWQEAVAQELNSISADPLFADPVNRDYHLKSEVGRWTGSSWATDVVHSASIDAGNPLTPLTDEIWPHGFRVNQGAYGNTTEASLSRSNAWLMVITVNDGGLLRDSATLQWSSGGLSSTNTVTLSYSPDAGATWTNIVTGISATDHQYEWDTTQVTSSLHALWAIELDGTPAIQDQTDNLFALRNEVMTFYVNNASTNGNVYTTVVGASGNNGFTPTTPKDSVQGILDAYPLIGGDTIYVDTGTYILAGTSPIRVIWSRRGDDSGNILIKGSTNYNVGGTVFHRVVSSIDIFDVKGSGITISDMTLQNANRAVLLDSNRLSVVQRSILRNNSLGILQNRTFGSINENLVVFNNRLGGIDVFSSTNSVVQNITFVGNSNYQHRIVGGANHVSQNNIFYLTATNSTAFVGTNVTEASTFIDYNVYYFPNTNGTAIFGPTTSLIDMQLAHGHDFRSAITNPLFASFATSDFRLQSTEGRWDGTNWIMDAEHSWAIDKGNPDSDYSNEPAEDGGRINIGAYGNTEQASKGRTNVVVETRTLNNETNELSDPVIPLLWTVNNVPTNLLVSVQYSGDGGASWYTLQTNVSAYQEFYLWQLSPFFNTYNGRWRIIGEEDSVIYAGTNSSDFTFFFGEFAIYTNYRSSARMNMLEWEGAWAQWYRVQYSTNAIDWSNAVSGADPVENAFFLTTNGGFFIYRDVESTNSKFRLYRILQGL